MLKRPCARLWVGAALLIAAALSTPAMALPEAPPKAAPDTPFDSEIAASKTAMMGEPLAAFSHARTAAGHAAAMPASAERELAVATAQWLEGEASTRLHRPTDAFRYLQPALKTASELQPDGKLQGDITRSRGRASAAIGHVQAALVDYQAAYRIYQHANEPRKEAMALQDIGSVYMDARDYKHVLEYYQQSNETFGADPTLNMTAHNNRGIALKELQRYPEAVAEFRAALAAAVQAGSGFLQAHMLTDVAVTEARMGRLSQARADAQRGLAIAGADPEARAERPFLLGVLAKVELESGETAKAVHDLDQAFAGVDLTKTTMDFRDFHEIAARVYDLAGQNSLALAHLKAFKRLDDQGRELAASTNAALMAAQFDFTNQNLKIANLKAGQLEAQARFRNAIFIGLGTVGAVVLAATIFGFLSVRRSRDRIQAANAQLGVANTALEKALQAKTEFLAATSHEIRTPLNGILGMTQVILADRSVPDTVRERLKLVRGAGETMKALVDDLLDIAKVETGAVTLDQRPFDLKQALNETAAFWKGQAQAKALTLELDTSEAPSRIVADESRLRQVIYNLMSNALKFTDAGMVALKCHEDGEWLHIEVSDTGIGIPTHEHERIFEPFTQVDSGTARKYGGTGLGLSICRKVVNAMAGRLTLKSVEGQGATFTVCIPLVVADAPSESPATTLEAASVLVLDANPLVQSMIRALVEPQVRAVAGAADLDEAVAALAAQPVDILLADGLLVLKDDGAAQRLAAAIGAGRLVCTLPAVNAADAPRLLAGGVNAVIVKPVSAGELIARLRDCMASPHASDVAVAA